MKFPRGKFAYPTGIAPGFNQNHPAAEGCVFSGVPMGSNNFVNLLTGQKGPTINNSPTYVTDGWIGPSVLFGNSADYILFSPPFPSSQSSVTTAAIFVLTNGSPAANAWICGNDGTGGFGFGGLLITSVTPVIQAVTGALSTNLGGNNQITPNVPYFVAYSSPSALNSNLNWVFVNMANGATQSGFNFSGAAASATSSLILGNKLIGGARPSLCRTAAHMTGFNNYLSIPQLQQWAADPWSFWYPDAGKR